MNLSHGITADRYCVLCWNGCPAETYYSQMQCEKIIDAQALSTACK